MLQKTSAVYSKRTNIFAIFLWILFWVIPWGELSKMQMNLHLAFLIDLIRLGIALGLFIVPGALLYILADQCDDHAVNLLEIVIVGFSFSTLIIAVIGFIGRLTGLSFLSVKGAFWLVGLIELVLLMVITSRYPTKSWWIVHQTLLRELSSSPLILALILAALMTINGYLFFYDDTTYLAYLTNWQFSNHLGFKNIVFDGNFIESARFWLALYPMGQAILSDLSGVPGLLMLSNYLEMLLVPGAVLVLYWFARKLGLSRKASGFASLIQVSLFIWMNWNAWPVGTWFFQSMAEDKVTAVFLLSPVFFNFILQFIQSHQKKYLILSLLSAFSIMFTHPIILFFACVIALSMAMFAWVYKQVKWQDIFKLCLVFVVSIIPYGVIRFIGDPSLADVPYSGSSASETFQIERYTHVINGIFYGLNPELLKFVDMFPGNENSLPYEIFRLTPLVLLIIGGVISLVNLKKGRLYWYVLSCVILILVAAIPYTGWLLGLFVSARLISRAAWFFPLGLSGVVFLKWMKGQMILWGGTDEFERIKFSKALTINMQTIGLIICFAFVAPLLFYSLMGQIPLYFDNLNNSRQIVQIGSYIERNSTYPTIAIALDYDDNQLLPGVSAKINLISFRDEKPYNGHNYFYTVDQIEKRISDSNSIRSLDLSIPVEKRCELIDFYDVRYVIAKLDSASSYENTVKRCGRKVEMALKLEDMVLFEFR